MSQFSSCLRITSKSTLTKRHRKPAVKQKRMLQYGNICLVLVYTGGDENVDDISRECACDGSIQRSYGAISEPTNPLLNGNWPSRSAIPKASLEASESSGSEPLPFEEDERIRKFRLRPLSMTASFYSAMSAPNAMQRVCATLECTSYLI